MLHFFLTSSLARNWPQIWQTADIFSRKIPWPS